MDIKHEEEEAKSTLPHDPAAAADVDIKKEQLCIEEEEENQEQDDRAPSANGGGGGTNGIFMAHHKEEDEKEEHHGNGISNGNQQHSSDDDGDPDSNPHSHDQRAPQINNDNGDGLPSTIANRKSVSQEDIQLVQNLVERCLQLYMPRSEVVDILKAQADIDPSFTGLVWEKLEEQNPDFFKAYYTRLKLKGQIIMFNHLLEQQVSMVQKMQMGSNGGGGGGGGGGIFCSSATTASGVGGGGGDNALRHIPLFQGTVDHHHHQQQQQQQQGRVAQDQEVPGPGPQEQQTAAAQAQAQAAGDGSGGDFQSAFAAHHHHHHHLDAGHSPLSPLPHIESENDLLNMTNHHHHHHLHHHHHHHGGTSGGTANIGAGVVPTPGTGGVGGIHLSQAPGVTPPMTVTGGGGRGGGEGGGRGGDNDDDDDGHGSGNLDNNNNLAMIPRTFSLSDLGYAEGGPTQ